MTLTEEQKEIINEALKGNNILVDACWGSGKTTTIQEIYSKLHETKKVLYLTYNARLKTEARNRIKSKESNIHNYDSYAYNLFLKNKINLYKNSGSYAEELAKDKYLKLIPKNGVDVLLIDEYQDINEYHSKIISKIAENNPKIQIIAVGDCDQKITNTTTLNALDYMKHLLGNFRRMKLSVSFRLSPSLSKIQGNIFNKNLKGVNEDLTVKYLSVLDIVDYFKKENIQPKDVMIIGSAYGKRADLQNYLETKLPKTFNKTNLYSDIKDTDGNEQHQMDDSKLKKSCLCITYDKCKGLERDIVVVCDFTDSYWTTRARKGTPYFVLKNLFGVAATRAKKELIFLNNLEGIVEPEVLKESYDTSTSPDKNINVTELFSYKCIEDIDDCFSLLDVKPLKTKKSIISIPKNDNLIDLSFVVGSYIEPLYFKNYSVDKIIKDFNQCNSDYKISTRGLITLKDKLLALAVGQTKQNRYAKAQLNIDKETEQEIIDRFNTEFTRDYPNIQFKYESELIEGTYVIGRIDALKDDKVYEFKFVNNLDKNHFLQLATYLYLSNRDVGILWNIQDNTKYEVSLKSRSQFKNSLIKLLDKKILSWETDSSEQECPSYLTLLNVIKDESNICFIDTETTMDNDLYSLGYVITDSNLNILHQDYYVSSEHEESDCIFGYNTYLDFDVKKLKGQEMVDQFLSDLNKYEVKNILAYNASFDCGVINSFNFSKDFIWRDMMQPLRTVKYNPYLPKQGNYDKFGLKLKSGYKVQDMYRYVINENYEEKHNALQDTLDEFEIYKKVGLNLKDCPKIED